MVAPKSPEGLPAGFTVNCKVLKSGRKLKYYTEVRTGKKFYSMNEVYRYMKSRNGNSFKIQQLHRCNGQIQKNMVAQTSPDSLPEGWAVNCKVLDSGRKLKYYTDLKTGKKLYSMNEVYRHIKSKNAKSSETKMSSGKRLKGSMKKYLQGIKRTNSDLGWLLDGWHIELKNYEAGPKMGKEYKVYVDKSTGNKCYSKLEVLRYVKKQNDKGRMVGEIQKAIVTRSKSCEFINNSKTKMEEHLNTVDVEYDAQTPDKKKLTRSALNATSEDPKASAPKAQKLAAEVIPPENAADEGTYVVRSKPVSDGHISGVQTRGSKKRQQSNLGDGCTSTSTAFDLKGDNISSGKLKMHMASKSGSLPSRFSKRLAKLEPELVTNYSTNDHDLAPPATVKPSDRDQKTLHLSKIEKVNDQGEGYQSISASDVDPVQKEKNTDGYVKKRNNSLSSTKINGNGRLYRRFSKRLAGVEPELVSNQDFSEKVVQGVRKRSCTDLAKSMSASAFTGPVKEACQLHSTHVQQLDLGRCLLNKSNTENGLELHQSEGFVENPRNLKSKTRQKRKSDKTGGTAKGLAEVEQGVITDSIGDVKTGMPDTSQHIPPETAGANKDHETQQQNPIWHTWSDPCLEFAFKTLTGEISIEDDLQIASFFHQSEGFVENPRNSKSKTRQKRKSDRTGGHAKQLPEVEQGVITDSIGDVKSGMPDTSQHIPPETAGANKDQETEQQNPIWHTWSDPCLEFAFKTLTGEISIEDDLQIASYFQQIEKPVQKDAGANNASLSSQGCSYMNTHQKSFSREQPQADLMADSVVGYGKIRK